MHNYHPSLWRCPLCAFALERRLNTWTCENKHSFDIAKEGYVNLLLAQHKNSKAPGDSKVMVMARRAFLSQQYYLPLATALGDLLAKELTHNTRKDEPISIFDAGCGEGYYLDKIAHFLLAQTPADTASRFVFSGIDIAKTAVQKAAKQAAQNAAIISQFAVASCFNLPILNGCHNAVIQIFAPSKPEEIHRILKTNGLWVQVHPASDHLFDLKNMVYDSPQKHLSSNLETDGFALMSSKTLKFELILKTPADRHNLLMMTPFYWSISPAKKQALIGQLSNTHAHFEISILRKI